jgi:hypothetical protein
MIKVPAVEVLCGCFGAFPPKHPEDRPICDFWGNGDSKIHGCRQSETGYFLSVEELRDYWQNYNGDLPIDFFNNLKILPCKASGARRYATSTVEIHPNMLVEI